MRERTLSIIKPDGVARNVMGEVIKRLEGAGLKITAMKMIRMNKDQAKGFYKVHEGKPFYESVTDFMSSGPCVFMVLEGEEAIATYRKLMGATNNRWLLTINDGQWSFKFQRGQALYANQTAFDPLTSFLDFYALIIIGMDMDTFENFGAQFTLSGHLILQILERQAVQIPDGFRAVLFITDWD